MGFLTHLIWSFNKDLNLSGPDVHAAPPPRLGHCHRQGRVRMWEWERRRRFVLTRQLEEEMNTLEVRLKYLRLLHVSFLGKKSARTFTCSQVWWETWFIIPNSYKILILNRIAAATEYLLLLPIKTSAWLNVLAVSGQTDREKKRCHYFHWQHGQQYRVFLQKHIECLTGPTFSLTWCYS